MDSISDEAAENPTNYGVLAHFPDVKEALEGQCATMASQAQVLHEKEQRVKTALAKVQSTVQRVF